MRALPGEGQNRCMGKGQRIEKVRHSAKWCQGLSVGISGGN